MDFPDLAISGGTVWMNIRQGQLLMTLSFLTTTSKPDDDFMKTVAELAWSLAKEANL